MLKCLHCGKEIPYEQTGVNFLFYHTDKDMTDEEKNMNIFEMSEDYNHLKFVYNFIAPCLCYDCCKELETYLLDFIKEK